MIPAMIAGKIENIDHTISFTAFISVMVTMVSPVSTSVPETKPAAPSNKATSEPEMAVPNFCAMVPDENIKPVDEVPFFSVA